MFSRLGKPAIDCTKSLARVGISKVNKATYFTKGQFEELPEKVKHELAETAPLPTQQKNVPECRFKAFEAQTKLEQIRNTQEAPTTSREFWSWTKENDELLEKGYPAVIHAMKMGTDESQWKMDHAVTVIKKDDNGYLIHDPDTTHHAKTQSAHEKGTDEPRHNLRYIASLDGIEPKVIDDQILAPITQRVPKVGLVDRVMEMLRGTEKGPPPDLT